MRDKGVKCSQRFDTWRHVRVANCDMLEENSFSDTPVRSQVKSERGTHRGRRCEADHDLPVEWRRMEWPGNKRLGSS